MTTPVPDRDLEHEPGAAAGTVLDPDGAAHRRAVLGDEGQTETGTDAMAGCAAAGEAFEDAVAFALGDTWPTVFDGEAQHLVARRRDVDAQRAAAVVVGVLDQVAEDTLESDLVDVDLAGRARVDVDVDVRALRSGRRRGG